jgi:pilus assembly protein CpaF
MSIFKGIPTQQEPTEKEQEEMDAITSELTKSSQIPVSDIHDDAYFQDFIEPDDEDNYVKEMQSNSYEFSGDNHNKTLAQIEASFRKLRSENPTGGLKSFRFLTTEIMLNAPQDFFDRYEENAEKGTQYVQDGIASKGSSEIIEKVQRDLNNDEAQDEAFRIIQGLAVEYLTQINVRGIERQVITYMIMSDIMGMSRIDPLWIDSSVNDLLINGPQDVQVEIRGHLYKVPSCHFRNVEHLENLIERIFGSIGKTLSRTTPYLDGRLYDQSRIAATHRIISPAGPNVAIRKSPDRFWTPEDLISLGSASQEMMTELGNFIYKGCSFIVIGGTGSGKTSALNALTGFFDPTQRVVTLEDTLELKPNPHKLIAAPMECVPANANKAGDLGVTMRELVRASLRLAPDGILIGEVRDGAMYDLCQALNTGHWGASTVHANSPDDGIFRMQSLAAQSGVVTDEGAINLIASAFDFIVMVEQFPEDGTRKITSIAEIDHRPIIEANGRSRLGTVPLWEYQSEGMMEDIVIGEWVKVGELSDIRKKQRRLDLTKSLDWDELTEISKI